MIRQLQKPLIALVIAGIGCWAGLHTYTYFTHITPPAIYLNNIDNDGFYADIIECSVNAANDYKIATVTCLLDGKELSKTNIKAKQFCIPIAIDTTELTEGKHTLDITAVDSSYNANETTQKIIFNVDNTPLRATFIESDYTVDQGKTLHMKIQSNKPLADASIKVCGHVHQFYPEREDSTTYECFIPIDCEEEASEHIVTAFCEDMVGNLSKLNTKVEIKNFNFPKQKGFTVAEAKLEEEKEVSMNTKILREAIEKWTEKSPKKKLWNGKFITPIRTQRMTTPHGEIRTTPERGRYMHKGVDLVNHPKCVVWSAQDGKVIIKDRYLMTGNTVVIDHGMGVCTLYAHLEDFASINVGDDIKKGNPLGKLGMTGYANGYHLHWELIVKNVSVDPLEWTSKVF